MENSCHIKKHLAENPLITDFLETYPSAKEVKQDLWELLIAAMGSNHADMWDGKNRAGKLFFYEQMGNFLEQIYSALKHQEVT